MSLVRSSIMSSISALKVALASKRESRVLISILLSFVFCFSSLKINIFAENITSTEAMNIAYAFFWNMGFRGTSDVDLHYMQNYILNGTGLNVRSPDVNPQLDTVYIVYYEFSGGDNIRITNSNDTLSVGLGGIDNLYIARISGNSSTKVYFSGNAQVIPIYVGNKNAMPSDIYALCTNENVQELLIDILSDSNSIKSDISSIKSMQVSEYQRLGSIVTNTNTTNSKLEDIKSYFISNTTTTNNNVTNNDNQKNTFDNKASSLATFESTQGTNLDTNLQNLNINSSSGLLVNSSFVKSALWVNSMFDRLIVGSPFELVLVFCLSIGIAFAMIGKVK